MPIKAKGLYRRLLKIISRGYISIPASVQVQLKIYSLLISLGKKAMRRNYYPYDL